MNIPVFPCETNVRIAIRHRIAVAPLRWERVEGRLYVGFGINFMRGGYADMYEIKFYKKRRWREIWKYQ